MLLADRLLTRPPAWLRPLYGGGEWVGAPSGPGGRPRLYLTFDDGPIPDETPWVLEQLATHPGGARATFFCVGDNVRRHPELARAIRAAGHGLGNHTQHHLNAWATPHARYLADVAECEASLADSCWPIADSSCSTEKPSANSHQLTAKKLFRPPYGRLTPALLRQLRPRYRVLLWSLLTRDYDPDLLPERALRLTLAATRPGDIIVLHDSRKASRSLRFLLPRLLQAYGEAGYELAGL